MTLRSLAVLGLSAILGCGGGGTIAGDDGGGGNSDQGVPLDFATGGPGTPGEFVKRYFGVYLDRLAGCCSSDDMNTREYALGHGLVSGFGTLIAQLIQAGFERGRITFNLAAGNACVTQLELLLAGQPCGATFMTTQGMLNACTGVTAGRQAAGQPCAFDPECQEGLACVGYVLPDKNNAAVDGTCVAPPAGGQICGAGRTDAGSSISITFNDSSLFGTHPACASGFYCSSSMCKAQAQAGAQCFDDDECVAGLKCHLQLCGQAGPSPIGGVCKSTSDCMPDAYCDNQTKLCAAKKPAGQSCTYAFSSECAGRCSVPDSGMNGTCVTYCGSK